MSDTKYGDMEFERRVFPRFVLHVPFTYKIGARKTSPSAGVTANASRSGLLVYLPEPVEEGEIINFKLSLSEGTNVRQVEAKARVVWITKSMLGAPKLFKAGLEFVEISEEALSFIEWFEQLWLGHPDIP